MAPPVSLRCRNQRAIKRSLHVLDWFSEGVIICQKGNDIHISVRSRFNIDTNGIPISFKVLLMVPLVIPLVPMVPLAPLVTTVGCQ